MNINSNYNFSGEFTLEEIEELLDFFRELDGTKETSEIEQLVTGVAQLKISDSLKERLKKKDLGKHKLSPLLPIQKGTHTSRKKTEKKSAAYKRMLEGMPRHILRAITQQGAKEGMQVTHSNPVVADASSKENHAEKPKKQDVAEKKLSPVSPIQKAKHTYRKETEKKSAVYKRMLEGVPRHIIRSITQQGAKEGMQVTHCNPVVVDASTKENHAEKPKKQDVAEKKFSPLSPIQKAKHTYRKEAEKKSAAYKRMLEGVPRHIIRSITQEGAKEAMQVTHDNPVVADASSKENHAEKLKKQDVAEKKFSPLSPIQKATHTSRKDTKKKSAACKQMLADLPLRVLQPNTQQATSSLKPKKQVKWEALATHKMTFAEGKHLTQGIPVVDESSSKENRDPTTPEGDLPIGRKFKGMRADRSLTEKAMTQRHISLIVLDNLMQKTDETQPQ